MFGLLERDFEYIKKALSKHSEIESAIIFGSRAMGNYKKGSDVDLTIVGEDINNKILFELEDDLNEVYPLPYFFDILIYSQISNENLIKHINEEGKLVYKK